ncbi:MAG: phytanoyl-CoA dioxygenase family protein [Azospirillum sp.]|nr:phytanoyl-CoA dioxygenase family protein [Azospirillum sp.]MCA3264694.1 phytanoyl-CoA dioxygenase family protein [Azospirillum sp.]
MSARAEAYAQDGVVCARGLLDAGWVTRLRAAVDRAMAAPSNDAMEFNAEGEAGRFFGDMFMHRRDADFRAAFFDSPCAALAGEAMDAAEVRLLYDQIFAKMPGTPRRTPWHQDGPYWPLSGDRLCTVYVALDPIDATSGAVAYARGSHRAEAFRPAPFRAGADAAARYAQSALPELAAPDPESLIAFDLAPGDAVVFHANLVHGAGGNKSNRPRRTLALRFAGEDVRWRTGVSTFRRLRKANLADGAPLSARDDLFPVLWRR